MTTKNNSGVSSWDKKKTKFGKEDAGFMEMIDGFPIKTKVLKVPPNCSWVGNYY